MYVRFSWGRLKQGSWDAFESDYETGVLNESHADGLQGRMLLRNEAEPDSGGTLSLWDSAEAMHAYEEGELREEVWPKLQGHFIGDYATYDCEVRLSQGPWQSAAEA